MATKNIHHGSVLNSNQNQPWHQDFLPFSVCWLIMKLILMSLLPSCSMMVNSKLHFYVLDKAIKANSQILHNWKKSNVQVEFLRKLNHLLQIWHIRLVCHILLLAFFFTFLCRLLGYYTVWMFLFFGWSGISRGSKSYPFTLYLHCSVLSAFFCFRLFFKGVAATVAEDSATWSKLK